MSPIDPIHNEPGRNKPTTEQAGRVDPVARPIDLLRSVGPVAPLVLVLFVWWAADGGGFSPGAWGLKGAGIVLLLAIAVVADPPVLHLIDREEKTRAAMLGALGAFVVWNFLSMTWADFPGEAWVGSDKTLLYATVFSLFALWTWDTRAVLAIMAAFVVAISAVGLVILLQADMSTHPATFFENGRLLPPIGYINANVALWMLAFWPAAFLGSAKTVPAPLRALSLGCAALLIDLSLMGQSRGWLFLMPLVIAAAVLFARQRLRLLLALSLPGVAGLAILRPLERVYEQGDRGHPIGPLLHHATTLVIVTSLAVGFAGLVWTIADRRLTLPSRVHRLLGIAVALLCSAAIIAGTVRTTASIAGDPAGWFDRHWSDFTRGYPIDNGGSRFTGSLGTDRYLQWKVAVLEFRAHPLVGVGSDNYAADYLLRRQTYQMDPRYPHSTPLRLLAQLGLIGTAFFALFAGAALWLALRRRGQLDPVAGGAIGTCLTIFVYWFAHGSIDWFWEIPALAAPAFGFLGLATSVRTVSRSHTASADALDPRRRRTVGATVRGLGAVLALAAVVSVVLPWLSYRYEMAGLAVWKQRPAVAYARLERAAALDRFSAEPYIIEGSIALERKDLGTARTALSRALSREPRNWYAYFQLALVAASADEYAQAGDYALKAQVLNPADPIITATSEAIQRGETINPDAINALYLKELNRRLAGNPKL